jgi:hypothetical protein
MGTKLIVKTLAATIKTEVIGATKGTEVIVGKH